MRSGWPAACFGILLVGSGCGRSSEPAPSTSTNLPTQTLQDFQMQDFREGKKSMNLVAKEGRLFEDQQLAELEDPVATFYKDARESSVMRAPKGKILTQTHEVEAWGGVHLVTTDSTTLTTDQLKYDPKTRLVTSTSAVHIEKPDSITDGTGLETDPELKHLKIGHQRVQLKENEKK